MVSGEMSEPNKMKAVAVRVTTTPNVVERSAGPFGERTVAPTHGVTGSLGTEQRRDQREPQCRSLSYSGDVGGEREVIQNGVTARIDFPYGLTVRINFLYDLVKACKDLRRIWASTRASRVV